MTDSTIAPEEVPEWLTSDFFKSHLSLPDTIKLKSIHHACAKGENFASKIYRVMLEFDGGDTKSLIVKSRPTGDGAGDEYIKKFNIFPKEIEMYECIDRFEKVFGAIRREITLAPK